jgi:hypothetical protein
MPTARSLRLRFALSRHRAAARRPLHLLPIAAAELSTTGADESPASPARLDDARHRQGSIVG